MSVNCVVLHLQDVYSLISSSAEALLIGFNRMSLFKREEPVTTVLVGSKILIYRINLIKCGPLL